MLIGFDGNEANVAKRVGSGQYAFEILRGLVGVAKDDKFAVYLKGQPRPDFPQATETVTYKIFGPKPLWTQLALPFKLYTGNRPDVFFSPAHYAPRRSPIPTVVTIHDLSYFTFPELFAKKDLQQLTSWTKYSVKQAAHIIVPSNATKDDVIRYYGYSSEKITVIPHGFDSSRFHDKLEVSKIKQVKQTYGIVGDYLVYVGTLQPRKNLIRLIESFALVKQAHGDLSLVIAGKRGWLYDAIFAKVNELGLTKDIIFTDYVPDESVPYLFAGAALSVYPSLYDGFGMPLLEAMACGTLVATANASSLPEIIGPGFLFDPKNVDDMTKTIEKALALSQSEKDTLCTKGIAHAQSFSWQKAAQQTLSVLHQAVAEGTS